MDVIHHSKIGVQHTMIEVIIISKCCWNGQEDQNIPALNIMSVWQPWWRYLLLKLCAWFTLQVDLTKHQQQRGLRSGNIIDIIPIEAIIMSLTLCYQSMDCLQANWWPSPGMVHHNFSLCSLLSISMSRSQNYKEESLPQIISDADDYSNDASQYETRNRHFQYQDAQILGIQKVVPCPDNPEAPASSCNKHDYHLWWDPCTMCLTEI